MSSPPSSSGGPVPAWDPVPARDPIRASDPVLARAVASQQRASRLGFDWDDPRAALAKVREETDELAAALNRPDGGENERGADDPRGLEDQRGAEDARSVEDELGDLLFAAVNVARLAGVDPTSALDRAVAKFEARFAEVERIARRRGVPMPGASLERLDRIWDEVKRAAG